MRIISLFILMAFLMTSGCDYDLGDRYVISTPKSGFANRMRSIASAYALAQHTKRKLIINWQREDVHMETITSFAQLFKSNDNLFVAYETLPTQRQELLKKAWKRYFISIDQVSVYDNAQEITENSSNALNIEGAHSFKPHGMSDQQYIDKIREFYRLLEPVDSLAQRIDNFKKSNFKPSDMVGVHYRSFSISGDFGGTPDRKPLFIKYMKEILAKNPATKFFLAADDLSIRQEITNNFNAGTVVSYPTLGVDRNSLAGQLDATADWYLLAHTDYIIGTYQSSFSEEAAHLTKLKRKINLGATIYTGIHYILCFDQNGDAYVRPNEPGDPCASGTHIN